MNSSEVLNYLESRVQIGDLRRSSNDDRLSKGVRYETSSGAQLQLDLGNDLAFFDDAVLKLRGNGQRRATLALEASRVDVNAAALIGGVEHRLNHQYSGGHYHDADSRLRNGLQACFYIDEEAGLGQLIQAYTGATDQINRAALECLKKRFLRKFPDFEERGAFLGQSSYHPEEDDYKRRMLAATQPLRGALIGSIPLGAKILDLLIGKQSNLLGYFKTNERLKVIRKEHPDVLERAVGDLANSDEKPPEAVETFLEVAWPLLIEGAENNKPYGESRILATVVQALTRPKTAISVIYQKFHNLGQALLGRSLFGNNPLSADEYRGILQLVEQLFAIMRDEWGWQPRDLWDVQGFIWVTCGQKLGDKGEMTDEAILRRFDGDKRFREARIAWGDDQKIAFCRIARAVHDVGLDWYHTPSYPVRFGRKFKGNQEASGTLASIYLTNDVSKVGFGNQHHKFDLEGTFNFDEPGAAAFEAAITGVRDELANWMPSESPRAGFWPDEYSSDHSDTEVSEQTMSPTNLILYGPPGTGKTYRTMQEAVRYCGVVPDDDRSELRKQYDQLRKEKRIEFVTFHQNFAYEEFIEGLRPETGTQDGETETGGFSLRPKLGIFRNICQLAEAAAAPKQYVLVIDEINRANISKVFGELITLIEPDKRLGMDEELKVRLPYSEDEFGVPANLHIIGTMNTADRSIALLDTALRRRFRFEEMAPDTSVEAFVKAEKQTGLPLAAVLETMNRKIEYLVDRDHRIGHAFFIGCNTKEHVDAAMRDKVIPLLQEYFFDDWNRLAAVLGEKGKGGNFLECETIEDPMGEGNEALKSWRVRKCFDHEAYERLVGKTVAVSSQTQEPPQSV